MLCLYMYVDTCGESEFRGIQSWILSVNPMTVRVAATPLNPVLFAFRSGFWLGKIHQFPNGYPTVFPPCHEPPFPRFDLGAAKLIVIVLIAHSNTFPHRGRCNASARAGPALPTLVLGRTRYGWSGSCEGYGLNPVLVVVEGPK